MSQVIIKTGIPRGIELSREELLCLELLWKKSMLNLRQRSLTAAMKFISVDRLVWTIDSMIPTAAIMMYPGRYSPDIYVNLNFLVEILDLAQKKLGNLLNITEEMKEKGDYSILFLYRTFPKNVAELFERAVASLIAHELMHFILKHLSTNQRKRLKIKQGDLPNLVFDIFINHFLYQLDLTTLMELYYPSSQHMKIDEILPVLDKDGKPQLECDKNGEPIIGERGQIKIKTYKTGKKVLKDTFPTFFLNPTIQLNKIDDIHHSAFQKINKVEWTLEQIEEYILKHLPPEQKGGNCLGEVILIGNHAPQGGEGEDKQKGEKKEGKGQEGDEDELDSEGKESGGSEGDNGDEEGEQKLPGSITDETEDIVREIFTKAKTKDKFNTGHSKLGEYFEERLRVEKKKDQAVDEMVLRALIRSTKGTILRAMGVYATDNMKQTVIPSFEDKKDLVLMAADQDLFFFQTQILVNRGKAVIYTDVSGSMSGIKEIIYSLLIGLEQEYEVELFVFSTRLYPLSKDDLRQGIVQTTGGTDFDIWINDLKEKKYEKVLVITDGYCSINSENQKFLTDENIELFVVYTQGHCAKCLEPYTHTSCVLNYKELY